MFDVLGEIFETMKRNKLRSFLTGFAVAWGIFMLIVLLGAGQGLLNGVSANFEGQSINTVTVTPGWTSMPYRGYRADRRIRFDNRTVDFLKQNIPEIGYLTGNVYYTPRSVSYGQEYGSWQITGALPDIFHINYIDVFKGRFVNQADERAGRKVIVIGRETETTLFKGEESLGKYIVADGIAFQVIGVYDRPQAQAFGLPCFIPLSTGQTLYDPGNNIRRITFTVNGITTEAQADALSERIRAKMGPYLGFDPKDTSAMALWNSAKEAIQIYNVLRLINVFLWVIGLACIMAGIVGVGNIMLVTVKERTREIGIRKALGATPWSIIRMVIIEAIVVTTAAGYIGIIMGLGLTELVGKALTMGGSVGGGPNGQGSVTMFQDPTVSLGIVFAVLGLLVACGVVAGLIPSLRATRIRPIEAMRAD